jgi:hypothetical protein
MLINFYHENPVSLCLATLDAFSPKRVVTRVADGIWDESPQPLGQKLKAEMASSMKDCNKHDLDPRLRALRDQLTRLRATEAASPEGARAGAASAAGRR